MHKTGNMKLRLPAPERYFSFFSFYSLLSDLVQHARKYPCSYSAAFRKMFCILQLKEL